MTDSDGHRLSVDGKDYFYVKDTLPSSNNGLDISGTFPSLTPRSRLFDTCPEVTAERRQSLSPAQALINWGGGVCGEETSPGAINTPTGFTVQILDEDDPEGAPLNDFVIPDSAASTMTTGAAANPTLGAAGSSGGGGGGGGDCPCTQEQVGAAGCCGGVGAICDWISNEPKLLGLSLPMTAA